MGSNIIRHRGIIQNIQNNKLEVMILSESACSSCKSKKVCSISEIKEKLLYIESSDKTYHIGDQVNVILEEKLGLLAILFAYFIPFIVIIAVLMIGNYSKLSEPIMGLGVLLAMIIYFSLLYFARNLFNKKMIFKVEKYQETNYNFNSEVQ